MLPESLKLLTDMRNSATDVSAFVAGKTLEDFLGDKQLRMAVERGFEIIGEALSQLRRIDPDTTELITDWRAIIGFQNVLIHGYGKVSDPKTWDIAQTEIPLLLRELDALLKN